MIPVLAFAIGVIVTTEFIVIGLLPFLSADLMIPLQQAGWLVSAFAMSAAILGPVLTLLTARHPPRLVMAAALVIFGAANIVTVLLPAFTVMLAVRLVQGALLTLLISLASTTAAAMAESGRNGQAIGQINLGTVLAVLIAMPAGAALANMFGWRILFAALGAGAIGAAVAVWRVVPQAAGTQPQSLAHQAGILQRGRFVAHLALSALLFTAMFAAYSYISVFFEQVLGFSGAVIGLALFGFGLAGLAGHWLALRVVDKNPTRLTAIITLGLLLTAGALSWSAGYKPVALLLLPLWGAFHTAAFVTCQVRVIFAAPDAQAFAASLNIAVCNLGIAVGAALGGWVVSHWGAGMIGLGTMAVGSLALAICAALLRPERPALALRS